MDRVKPVSVALDAKTVNVLDGWSERWHCSRSQVVRFLAAQAELHDPQRVLPLDLAGGPGGVAHQGKRKRT